MSKRKIGIVGLSRGRGFVKVFSAHPSIEVAALCDMDQDRLAQVGQAFDLSDEALFTDFDDFVNAPVDVVMIATPIAFHAEQTIKSLESGKHVLCEQTAAYSVEDCERIVNAVKATGKHYMMAENYSYFHYVREWQKMIDRGDLGRIFYAEGEYVHEIIRLLRDPATGDYRWRHSRPPIWYCAHCLGPLLTLMDDRIVKACGVHTGFNKVPDESDHIGFLDMEVGLFRTLKGAVIKILRSQVAHRYPHMVWYSLYGTKGYVENSRADRHGGAGLLYIEKPGDETAGERDKAAETIACPVVDPNAPEDAAAGGHGTSEYYMIREFIDALDNDVRPPIDVMRAMDFTVPGLIAHESAMTDGGWRDVPLFEW